MMTTATTTRSSPLILPISGVTVLLLQLLSIIQMPMRTNGNVLSNKVVPICEAGCHCFGSGGNCPAYPTITETMLPTYRALNYVDPLEVRCDPFNSTATECVPTLEQGEACVVDLIAPDDTTSESSTTCPNDYSYRYVSIIISLIDVIAIDIAYCLLRVLPSLVCVQYKYSHLLCNYLIMLRNVTYCTLSPNNEQPNVFKLN